MPCRRCPTCETHWPDDSDYSRCPDCRKQTLYRGDRIADFDPETAARYKLHADFDHRYAKREEERLKDPEYITPETLGWLDARREIGEKFK